MVRSHDEVLISFYFLRKKRVLVVQDISDNGLTCKH
jgi:hypothetical protein